MWFLVMKRFVSLIFVFLVISGFSAQATGRFGDLAVLLAKGYFKNHVSQDASMSDCVAFLNNQGICFSLFDLMDPNATVKKEDFARVTGQSTLLFLGEAEIESGCIKKPLGIETWVDYCLLNDVDLGILWNGFLQRMERGSVPEVLQFFGETDGEDKNDE